MQIMVGLLLGMLFLLVVLVVLLSVRRSRQRRKRRLRKEQGKGSIDEDSDIYLKNYVIAEPRIDLKFYIEAESDDSRTEYGDSQSEKSLKVESRHEEAEEEEEESADEETPAVAKKSDEEDKI